MLWETLMTKNPSEPGAIEILEQLEKGTVSALEYAEALVGRVEKHQDLNAVKCFDADLLIQNAQRTDQQRAAGNGGALLGLPFIAKDNLNSVAFPTTACTGALQGFTPGRDAGVITELLQAGAILGGKANMHELAFGITSNNAVTGPVRNPADHTKIAGGSSGGTAAAVAAGIFPIGLGTDTGGSCRIPAALCGVVGFRPSTGRYSGSGIVPVSQTRDTVGPIARSVADIALFDKVLGGDTQEASVPEISDITLGVPRDIFYENLDPLVEQAINVQLGALESAGAKLVEVSMPDIWAHNEAFGFPVVLYEVMRELPAYLAEHVPDISFDDLIAGIGSPDVAGIIASQMGDEAMPEAAYRAALDTHRPAMHQIYRQMFKTHNLDAIIFPTTPLPARDIGEDETVDLNGSPVPTFPTYIRNTDLGSNLGAPGISLPCPVINGLPVGIELDGLPGHDAALLGLAKVVEEVLAP
jgi:indoleacetamide hydrolase